MSNAKKDNKKDNKKESKLTIKKLILNTLFMVKETYKIDPHLIIRLLFLFFFCSTGYTLLDTFLFKKLVDMLIDNNVNFLSMVILIVLIGVLAFLVQLFNSVGENYARSRFVFISGKIQEQLIKKASRIDIICYDNKQYFDDFVIAASQADEMMTTGILSVMGMIGTVAGIFTAGALIFTINPIIAIFPISGFIINLITRFKITSIEYEYDVDRKRLMRKADYSRRVFYQPEYAKEIKLSSIDIPLRAQFNEALDEIEGKAKKAGIKIAILSLINWISVYTITSYLIVPLYLSWLVLKKGKMTLGGMTATDNAQNSIRNYLDGLNYLLVDFQRVGQFAEKFRRFLEYKINIEEELGTVPVPSTTERKTALLEIKNAYFRYEGSDTDTLSGINMTIKPGEHIAIVGENGAGKTTFIKLLMRLYNVTSGSIEYAGHNINDYGTQEYRSIIGPVFQDFQLYGASLAENILMDNPVEESNDTETKQEQEQRLLKAIDLADFTKKFSKLKNGLQTQMTREFSEEGTMLSGGESQKVAISRMFAKNELYDGNMSIAILDEPSSALDPNAECILNQNMLKAAGDASVIFISHRLSTTRDADKIYLFEQGRIIEEGTHDELMALKGEYAAMFDKQAHYYQEEI